MQCAVEQNEVEYVLTVGVEGLKGRHNKQPRVKNRCYDFLFLHHQAHQVFIPKK